MNTGMCFVFLLAIGLSTQRAEFEIDFDNLVKEKNLLDCPENCNDVKEPACTCVYFFSCTNSPVYNCIKSGLKQLNYDVEGENLWNNAVSILGRLKSIRKLNEGMKVNWHTPQSPAVFLNYIKSLFQKSAARAAHSMST